MPSIGKIMTSSTAKKNRCPKCGSRIYWSRHTGKKVAYNLINNFPHSISCKIVSKARRDVEIPISS